MTQIWASPQIGHIVWRAQVILAIQKNITFTIPKNNNNRDQDISIKKLMDNNGNSPIRYSINLSFEEIKLPPFQDILILGKNSAQGKIGLSKSFELLAPNGFDIIEMNDDKVEAVFVNKRILAKMPRDKIIDILKSKVFQFISEGELLKVDFKVTISYANIEHEM